MRKSLMFHAMLLLGLSAGISLGQIAGQWGGPN